MQAVNTPMGRHGLIGGCQRLPQDLTAENAVKAKILTPASKNIIFDPFKLQKCRQLCQNIFFNPNTYRRLPHRLRF
jgi:hypothetical protein